MSKLRLINIVYAIGLLCMAAVQIDRFMNEGARRGDTFIAFIIVCFGTWGYFTLRSKYRKEKELAS